MRILSGLVVCAALVPKGCGSITWVSGGWRVNCSQIVGIRCASLERVEVAADHQCRVLAEVHVVQIPLARTLSDEVVSYLSCEYECMQGLASEATVLIAR